jgi:endogenous inhibitor of DNA gyrase (YacG/DUF329 family)
MSDLQTADHSGKQNIKRDAPVTCQACGRRVARKSRQQKFCSDNCRQFALRENRSSQLEARTANKNPSGYQDGGLVTNPPKSANKNNGLQGAKSGSSIPLNVLGGYHWPNAPKLDRHTWANVIRREIGGVW